MADDLLAFLAGEASAEASANNYLAQVYKQVEEHLQAMQAEHVRELRENDRATECQLRGLRRTFDDFIEAVKQVAPEHQAAIEQLARAALPSLDFYERGEEEYSEFLSRYRPTWIGTRLYEYYNELEKREFAEGGAHGIDFEVHWTGAFYGRRPPAEPTKLPQTLLEAAGLASSEAGGQEEEPEAGS